MNRIVAGPYAEEIGIALGQIPRAIVDIVVPGLDFLTGTDPIWAGLHTFAVLGTSLPGDEETAAGTRAHYVGTYHQCLGAPIDRRPTIVLPTPEMSHWSAVVHEIGHALDDLVDYAKVPEPVSDYAKVDEREAFAMAFQTYVFGQQGQPELDKAWSLLQEDRETVALFDYLASGDFPS